MSDPFFPLPANNFAAIYDWETKRLYLWASGIWDNNTSASFQRDPDWVGGLKFKFLGYKDPNSVGHEDELTAASVFPDIILASVEGDIKEVVIAEANGDKLVKITVTDQLKVD
jgi:hypothetical protein